MKISDLSVFLCLAVMTFFAWLQVSSKSELLNEQDLYGVVDVIESQEKDFERIFNEIKTARRSWEKQQPEHLDYSAVNDLLDQYMAINKSEELGEAVFQILMVNHSIKRLDSTLRYLLICLFLQVAHISLVFLRSQKNDKKE